MAERMQSVQFYDDGDGVQVLHIETDGAIYNIRVGLRDTHGRAVEALTISALDESRSVDGDGNGGKWLRFNDRLVRFPLNDDTEPAPLGGGRDGGAWSLVVTGVDLHDGDEEWERIAELVAEGHTSGEIEDPSPPFHWHVGSNVPGYLPESDVRCFTDDAEDAREALLEELRLAQDAMPDCEDPQDDGAPCGREECGGCTGHGEIQAVLDEPDQITLDLDPTCAGGYAVDIHDGRALPITYWITRVARADCEVDSEYV